MSASRGNTLTIIDGCQNPACLSFEGMGMELIGCCFLRRDALLAQLFL
ncbi:hypothetical protein [Prevotella fusca]